MVEATSIICVLSFAHVEKIARLVFELIGRMTNSIATVLFEILVISEEGFWDIDLRKYLHCKAQVAAYSRLPYDVFRTQIYLFEP